MPAFLLEYKLPEDLCTSTEEEEFLLRAQNMADKIQAKASEIFFGRTVSYQIREIVHSSNMPDFHVTGWVTDNDDSYADLTLKTQAEVLAIMARLCFEDETPECWWQRVKGKWGKGRGLMKRPS